MTVVSSRTVAPHNREQVPAAVLTVTAVGARGAGRRGTQQLEAVAHVTPGPACSCATRRLRGRGARFSSRVNKCVAWCTLRETKYIKFPALSRWRRRPLAKGTNRIKCSRYRRDGWLRGEHN
ncbi:hypothetical protein MRX96_034373 [Rhipicephalus microplus]